MLYVYSVFRNDFIVSRIAHLKNIGSLSCADLSLFPIKIVTFINITTDFIKKLCKYWEAGISHMSVASFPKLIGNRYYQLFSRDKLPWIIFEEISARYRTLNNYSLSALFSKNSGVP